MLTQKKKMSLFRELSVAAGLLEFYAVECEAAIHSGKPKTYLEDRVELAFEDVERIMLELGKA